MEEEEGEEMREGSVCEEEDDQSERERERDMCEREEGLREKRLGWREVSPFVNFVRARHPCVLPMFSAQLDNRTNDLAAADYSVALR